MPYRYIFADEAGCFTFKRIQGASRYFVLCTLATDDCALANDLLNVRRDLAIAGDSERDKLHATSDSQATRDQVFAILAKHNFRVDATLLEKSKAQPQTKTDDATFYRYAWFYHFKSVGPQLLQGTDKLLITTAALGHKKSRMAFKNGVNNVLQQTAAREKWECCFMDSAKEPLLWAADYCAWAIQRKWDGVDVRSHDLIAKKIVSEFDLWKNGATHY
jgi:Protein of unknown function (DUF3800)